MTLPPNLASKIALVWGDRGSQWSAGFDDVLSAATLKWGLTEIRPFENLSYHFVARALQGQTPVVLKLGVPEPWFFREADALREFAGGGVAHLLDQDEGLAAILLEDVEPGSSLQESWSEADDPAQTRILAETMVSLWRDPPIEHRFDTPQKLTRAFDCHGLHVPEPLVKEAARRWAGLISTSSPPQLLHGDLHHGNVLRSGTGYNAIDPMGIVGDPAFEVYALLHNPVQATVEQTVRLLEPRLRTVSEVTGIDFWRLAAWGFCGTVMSHCWDEEDGGQPSNFELAAELLKILKAASRVQT